MSTLDSLEQRLGVSFRDKDLLTQAMVHRSYINENPTFALDSNERMEFLGDVVLGLVVAERLYNSFPDLPEGRLTRLRSAVVCQDMLFQTAQRIGLGEFLLLGNGEDASGGRDKPTNLARALEALIGAVYLDLGIGKARDLIIGLLGEEICEQSKCAPADYKSQLQELLHARKRATPSYHIVDASGPDHEKVFTSEVIEGGNVLGKGSGHSKKASEASAARAALARLERQG
ncbi:MAG: ribonuclease III [Dehalococcoidia bacterium]|nr:ribonuclease III [Dehalococcoidia bacterium]